MSQPNQSCTLCRFWKPLTNNNGYGECHRHAPVALDEGTAWPLTMAESWCGDWETNTCPQCGGCGFILNVADVYAKSNRCPACHPKSKPA